MDPQRAFASNYPCHTENLTNYGYLPKETYVGLNQEKILLRTKEIMFLRQVVARAEFYRTLNLPYELSEETCKKFKEEEERSQKQLAAMICYVLKDMGAQKKITIRLPASKLMNLFYEEEE